MMPNLIHLTKIDAARRQLKVAIELLFDDVDPVAVHTLVGAASLVISDLVEHHKPDSSWDKKAQKANEITASEYFSVMRKPQNFLKHAKDDPESTFNFDPEETDHLVFWTVMNLSQLCELSMAESVLQLWFLVSHAERLDLRNDLYESARQLFGDLRNKPRTERLAIGKLALIRMTKDDS